MLFKHKIQKKNVKVLVHTIILRLKEWYRLMDSLERRSQRPTTCSTLLVLRDGERLRSRSSI